MGSKNYLIPVGASTLTDQSMYRLKAIAAGIARATEKRVGGIADDEKLPDNKTLAFPEGYNSLGTPYERAKAILAALKNGWWPKQLDVREFQPILDAGAALDQWNTAALAVVGTAYSCFQAIPAPALANNKVAVFWSVAVETAPMPVSRLIIRSGGAAGNILGIYDLEQMVNRLEIVGVLSEPAVIDPSITFAVQVLCRIATTLLARVQLGAFIVEPQGQTIA